MRSMSENSNILIKNLYYLLAYAFPNLNWKDYNWEGRKSSPKEEFESAYDFFAWWLAKSIENQIKRGLYRQYQSREENLTALCGKIIMPDTIRNYFRGRRVLTCEYDELTENNFLNQILKTTALRLIKCEMVTPEWKTELSRELSFFSNVGTIDLKRVQWNSLSYQKNNKFYRELIAVCRFILEGLPTNGDKNINSKTDYFDEKNMPKLYEKFILGYYKKEHPELKPDDPKIQWAGVLEGETGMLPEMKTDIVLQKENHFLVIDAKFYTKNTLEHYGVEKIRSNNLYQIFAYVKNKNADSSLKGIPHTVSGMLLYAHTTAKIQPKGSWNICGNSISVRTLDLNCDFRNEIAPQLDEIARDYFS